ncbi:MAG TPA: hypothetical protein VGO52_17010 [Hyphomonadaceae bacterium]|jgi:hypothetical protein|nr:hypothetical protein [Hyphomonadaceae bacterium]
MIEPDENGEGVYLFRYTQAGEIDDTWHESAAEAFGQAEFEYEVAPESWVKIPPEVDNPIAFCRAQARTTHG